MEICPIIFQSAKQFSEKKKPGVGRETEHREEAGLIGYHPAGKRIIGLNDGSW
jgi:hypothetical protein